jgi:hypothetical protein
MCDEIGQRGLVLAGDLGYLEGEEATRLGP